ncbi:MAG: MCE family protein [Planctomycetes bacterium]|nr:MCE family protein [Planctomycetota bacterium]
MSRNHDRPPLFDSRAREVRVGAMVIVACALFVALLGVVSGATLTSERQVYTLRFDQSVKGMVVGSRVNFQGVPIGAVQDIRFDRGETTVEIEVDPTRAELQSVVRAHLDRAIVTGQVTIELEGWQSGAPRLPPGALIQTVPNPIQALAMDLPELAAAATAALTTAQRVLARAERTLADDNLARLDRTLSAAEGVVTELPARVAALDAELRGTLGALRDVAAAVGSAVEGIGPAATRATDELAVTLQRAEAALAGLDRLAAGGDVLGDDLGRVAREVERLLAQNQQAVRTLLVEGRDAMRELRSLARQLRAAPSSLLFGVEADEPEIPARPRGGER